MAAEAQTSGGPAGGPGGLRGPRGLRQQLVETLPLLHLWS